MQNITSATISVVVPVYNAEPYLKQALDSVCGQTHRELEIICINDGSTDGSLGIMRACAARDGRVVVVDKANEGYGATCNRGIDAAHGEWVAVLEPDDWIEPAMFADMLAFAAALDEVPDVVKTPYWSIIDHGTPHEFKVPCRYKGRVKPKRQPFALAEATQLIRHRPSIWSAIYQTSFLREKDIRFVEAPGSGWTDNPFLYETLCQTDKIAYLDQPYYCYREESPERSAAFLRNNPFVPIDRWNEMTNVLERLGVTDPGILGANCKRGLNYLRLVFNAVGTDNTEVNEAARRMASRMDAAVVEREREISPQNRALFAELTGASVSTGKARYVATLAKEAVASAKSIGFANTLKLKRSMSAK